MASSRRLDCKGLLFPLTATLLLLLRLVWADPSRALGLLLFLLVLGFARPPSLLAGLFALPGGAAMTERSYALDRLSRHSALLGSSLEYPPVLYPVLLCASP